MLIAPVSYRPVAMQATNNIQRSYASNVAFGRTNDEYEKKDYKPGPIDGTYIRDIGDGRICVKVTDKKGNILDNGKGIFGIWRVSSYMFKLVSHDCNEKVMKTAYNSVFKYIKDNYPNVKIIITDVDRDNEKLVNFNKNNGFKFNENFSGLTLPMIRSL